MPNLVINARKAVISEGFEVRRILPFRQRRMVGPFIFMDHGGPLKMDSKIITSLDVLPHPHIGLSTVTYLFGGHVVHRDSLGIQQVIKPGEVNWMTAAKGISHSERFEMAHSLDDEFLEMLQTWVALPKNHEEDAPDFTNYRHEDLPAYTDKGVWMRLIAGEVFGLKNKVKTHSPLFYLHVKLDSGARLALPENYSERAAYIVKGKIELTNESYSPGQMLDFSKNERPVIKAVEPSTIMLLGGEPLGERFIWWNFVSSRKERIEQAKADWKAGRIRLPQLDNKEFIPLPENKLKSASSGAVPPPELLS